jgi:hypothetical protein
MRASRVVRLIGLYIVACAGLSLAGRWLLDFEDPPEIDPHDTLRGVLVLVAAGLIVVLIDHRLERTRRDDPPKDAV